jgi:hypothetical protein
LRGAHLTTRPQHNEDRIKEIEKGKFDAATEKLKKADEVELRRMYAAREIEPAL